MHNGDRGRNTIQCAPLCYKVRRDRHAYVATTRSELKNRLQYVIRNDIIYKSKPTIKLKNAHLKCIRKQIQYNLSEAVRISFDVYQVRMRYTHVINNGELNLLW